MTERDDRTPAQVAEDAEREAHRAVCHRMFPAPPCEGDSPYCRKKHLAISRAIKAARWEQHAKDCAAFNDEPCEGETLCIVGDCLRREYEEATVGK